MLWMIWCAWLDCCCCWPHVYRCYNLCYMCCSCSCYCWCLVVVVVLILCLSMLKVCDDSVLMWRYVVCCCDSCLFCFCCCCCCCRRRYCYYRSDAVAAVILILLMLLLVLVFIVGTGVDLVSVPTSPYEYQIVSEWLTDLLRSLHPTRS